MKIESKLTFPVLVIAMLFPCVPLAFAQQAKQERPYMGTPQPKRPWGPEQATGAPDTPNAGDLQTAWASLLPDAGLEWLQVGFQKSVAIAEVRIRETFNPGAVCKVVALDEKDREQILWEGQDATSLCRRIS